MCDPEADHPDEVELPCGACHLVKFHEPHQHANAEAGKRTNPTDHNARAQMCKRLIWLPGFGFTDPLRAPWVQCQRNVSAKDKECMSLSTCTTSLEPSSSLTGGDNVQQDA